MAKKRYSDLLLDPRWQRKRLEILQIHDFACQECDARDKTLHVHHGYYEKDILPWEYPDSSLHCLCEDCHKNIQTKLLAVHRLIGELSLDGLERICGYVQAGVRHKPTRIIDVHQTYTCVIGMADVYHVHHNVVLDLINNKNTKTQDDLEKHLLPIRHKSMRESLSLCSNRYREHPYNREPI